MVWPGLVLAYDAVKGLCCRRRSVAAESKQILVTTGIGSETESDSEKEIEQLLKLKQSELRELCMQKKLSISGNKRELAARIASWKPVANKPSAAQLKQLHELEISRRTVAGPSAYVDSHLCKKAIAELSKLPKS